MANIMIASGCLDLLVNLYELYELWIMEWISSKQAVCIVFEP